MFTLRTVDDRGRSVRMPLAFVRFAMRLWHDDVARRSRGELLRRAARVVLSGPVLVLAGAIALITLGITVAIDDPGVGLWLLIFSPVYSSLFMFTFSLVRGALGLGGKLTEKVRSAVLLSGRCPACGYNVRACEAEGDGCSVCPECGAAWESDATRARRLDEGRVVVLKGWARPTDEFQA